MSMRALVDRLARHAITTTVAAALLIGAAGSALWPRLTGAESQPGQVVTLDGWPSDGASAVVWLEDGRQVDVQLGVPTTLDGAIQAAVLTRNPSGWAQCSITVNGERVSSNRSELADSPASCSWPR